MHVLWSHERCLADAVFCVQSALPPASVSRQLALSESCLLCDTILLLAANASTIAASTPLPARLFTYLLMMHTSMDVEREVGGTGGGGGRGGREERMKGVSSPLPPNALAEERA